MSLVIEEYCHYSIVIQFVSTKQDLSLPAINILRSGIAGLNVSWYKYLIVSLVFSHLGFWSGNLFLIAPFPDLCLLVPF